MTSTLTAGQVTATGPLALRLPWRRFAAAAVGVVAGLIAVIGAGNPSYWGDEAASVLSAGRDLPSLMQLLGHTDAVHGAYYLFLHFWMGIAGTSEAAVRFPSAVAVGLAATGTVALGRRLIGLRLGIFAGLIFAILPTVTRMGAEARSYALAIAAAVWVTVWFVELTRREETRRHVWVLFGVAAAASLYLFLYLAFLVLVQLTALSAFRSSRLVRRRWLEAMIVTGVCAAPILYTALSQRGQISFLAHRGYANAASVFVGQWFGSPVFAVLAWAFIAIGVAAAFDRSRRSDLPGVLMVLVWFSAPTVLLLAGNAWLSPMYNRRYLAFCAPAVAVLIALGIARLAALASDRRLRGIVVGIGLIALVGLAIPRYVAQRGPYGKDGGSDLRQTAEVVAAHASPGGAILFDTAVKPSRMPRLAVDLYPQSFTGLADVALLTPYVDRPSLWDAIAPTDSLAPAILRYDTVWVIESGAHQPDVDRVRALGYRVEQTLPVHRTIVYELSKE